jgi:hypothetical protein
MSPILIEADSKHFIIDNLGNPAQCLIRFILSSSKAIINSPFRNKHADESA